MCAGTGMLGPEEDAWCPSLSFLPSPLVYCTASVAWRLQIISSDSHFFSLCITLVTCIYGNICLCTWLLESKSRVFIMHYQKEFLLTIENNHLETWRLLLLSVRMEKDASAPPQHYICGQKTHRTSYSNQYRMGVLYTDSPAAMVLTEDITQKPVRYMPYLQWEPV